MFGTFTYLAHLNPINSFKLSFLFSIFKCSFCWLGNQTNNLNNLNKLASTAVGCHALLQRIFPTQESNPGLLHCNWATREAQSISINSYL